MAASVFQSILSSSTVTASPQTAETLPVLTSDYSTDTVLRAVIILNDVATTDRATCFSKYRTQN